MSLNQEKSLKPSFSWYILHVYSGSEFAIKDSIMHETNANIANLEAVRSLFKDVIIPLISESNANSYNKQIIEKKAMSGYMFVNMIMCDESYSFVMAIPKVIGFLGGKKPAVVSEYEVSQVLEAVKSKSAIESKSFIDVGDNIEVLEGPLESMNGVVTSVNLGNKTASVSISIFGSSTIVVLSLDQIKKT